MAKSKYTDRFSYADHRGMQLKDEYDHEGNLNDNDNFNKDLVASDMANNYTARRTQELLGNEDVAKHLKADGVKGIKKAARQGGAAALDFVERWGAAKGIHNAKNYEQNDELSVFRDLSGEARKATANAMENQFVGQNEFSKFKDSQQTSSAVLPEPAELSERSQAARDYLTDKRNDFGLGDDTGIFKSRFGGDFMDTRAAEQGEYQRQTTPSDESTDGLAPGTSDVAVSESAIDNTNEQAAKNMKDNYSFNVKGALKLAGVSTRGPGTKFGA